MGSSGGADQILADAESDYTLLSIRWGESWPSADDSSDKQLADLVGSDQLARRCPIHVQEGPAGRCLADLFRPVNPQSGIYRCHDVFRIDGAVTMPTRLHHLRADQVGGADDV